MKFRFEGNHLSWENNEVEIKVTIDFETESIEYIVSRFKEFLAGCGYDGETIKEWIGE